MFEKNSICFSCGEKQGLLDYNYSGMSVNIEKIYPFPFRINFPTIPGNNSQNFLCGKCINRKYKVGCSEHGILHDRFEYGQPPVCYKCKKELSDLINGVLPHSFKGLVPLSKLKKGGKYSDTNIFLGITKNDFLCIIEKGVLYHNNLANFEFEIKEDKFNGKPIHNKFDISFEINYKNKETFINGKGNWIFPWLKLIQKNLEISENEKICFSDLEYLKVENGENFSRPKKINSIFWTIKNNEIKVYNDGLNLPSLDNVDNWSIDLVSFPGELKILFKESYKPSLLKINELVSGEGLVKFGILNLPSSKKIESFKLTLENKLGIFKFRTHENINEEYLLENKSSFILVTNLSDGSSAEFRLGYCFDDYLLLIDSSNQSYIVTEKKYSCLEKIKNTLNIPSISELKEYPFNIFLFDYLRPERIIEIEFSENDLNLNKKENIKYNDILTSATKKISDYSILNLEYNFKTKNKKILLVGPSKYVENISNFIENKKAKSGLNTIELYEVYNKNKKNNLLIGLLSDLLLLNKEIEKDRSTEDLYNEILSMNPNEFMENKEVFKFTVKKLMIFIKTIPNIKQNLELLNSFFPHYHAKDEMDFISEAFGKDIAEKLNGYEYDIVKDISRQGICLIQSKIQRALAEIERYLTPIESFFTKDEIENEYLAKVAKYSSLGGQAILVGTLLATGGATGGIGILAGMLGIRAMSDYFNVLSKNKEKGFLIKKSAERSFSWWITFKKTLPVTIYELDRILNKENDRCLKRDQKIFSNLSKKNNFSVDKLNKALENRIVKINRIRFNEIIKGTGILFNDVANEIEEKKKFEINTHLIAG